MQGNIQDLRRVQLYFTQDNKTFSSHPTEHFCLESQVDALARAAVELHHTRETNPYSGGPTSRLWCIKVGNLTDPKAYWHTTPGLKDNGTGGQVAFWNETNYWEHPELTKLYREIEDQDD